MSAFAEWDSFYVIVGSSAGASSAGALIGSQFIFLTLIAERPTRPMLQAGAAFGAPTIVHFSLALLLSALMRVPWKMIDIVAGVWAVVGLGGPVYMIIVLSRMRKQPAYNPVPEDWAFHIVLPIIAYVVLPISAAVARSHTDLALFGIGSAVLLLLFIGIHNAWDSVSYYVFVAKPELIAATNGSQVGTPEPS